MSLLRLIAVLVLLIPSGTVAVAAQSAGSLEVSGRVKIGGKVEKLTRKRFYLFRGGLEANKTLVEKLKAASVTSRDCFYCAQKASPEFIAWLKAEECESPYCRAITVDDTKKVPEFLAAYDKGLKQFRNKPAIAQQWLTTNLSPNLRDGFYKQQKASISTILGTVKPLQSSMTDSVSVKAIFIDIPVSSGSKPTETFLVSNIIPLEFGGKSYLWACEVEIGSAKKVTLALQVPEAGKTIKKCEVIVKDLPACAAGVCAAK
ncbi:MAG TPA: hypothetical protein PLP21_04650 [Pyrinomonadaceae bacterium]|nr:hypothetical protein [Acidobacteriota bacterium]HQZ95583.1 hypothetical protein [Pyrinomonadaceae bacterium]